MKLFKKPKSPGWLMIPEIIITFIFLQCGSDVQMFCSAKDFFNKNVKNYKVAEHALRIVNLIASLHCIRSY